MRERGQAPQRTKTLPLAGKFHSIWGKSGLTIAAQTVEFGKGVAFGPVFGLDVVE